MLSRKYGVVKVLGGPDGERSAVESLRLQTNLWNALVELDHQHRANYRALLAGASPELTDLYRRSDDARRFKPHDLKELSIIRPLMKRAAAAARDLRRDEINQLDQNRRVQARKLAKASGLWWCHWEFVLNTYEESRSSTMKAGDNLAFKQFKGEGTLLVRFSGTPVERLAALSKVSSGVLTSAHLRAADAKELGRRALAKTASGSERKVLVLRAGLDTGEQKSRLSLLLSIHRPLPLGMELKTIAATRRKVGLQYEWTVAFLFGDSKLPLPSPDQADSGTEAAGVGLTLDEAEAFDPDQSTLEPSEPKELTVVGIDVGWRMTNSPDGGTPGLRAAVCATGQGFESLELPGPWVTRISEHHALLPEITKLATQIKDQVSWLEDRVELDGVALQASKKLLTMLRSREDAPSGLVLDASRALSSELAARKVDLFLRDQVKLTKNQRALARLVHAAHHKLRKALDARNHLYLNFAANLAERFDVIVVEELDLQEIDRKVHREHGSRRALPSKPATSIPVAPRKLVALSELLQALQWAATSRGKQFIKVTPSYSTTMCMHCGHINGKQATLHFTCEACGTKWDQDENAAFNIRSWGQHQLNLSQH